MIQFFELVASVIMEDGRRTTVDKVIPAHNLNEAMDRLTTICLRDDRIDLVIDVVPVP